VFNYYTFSQCYHIAYLDKYNRESRGAYFGFSTSIRAGLQKKSENVAIAPTFLLPVYASWKQDAVFPKEVNDKSRSKWLKGVGFGIAFNYFLY
jgi:hypothetical protein